MTKDTRNIFAPLRMTRRWGTNCDLALAMCEEMRRDPSLCAEGIAGLIVHEFYLHTSAGKPIFDATGAKLEGVKSDPEAVFTSDMGGTLRDYLKRADGKPRALLTWRQARRTQFYEFALRLRRARLGQSPLVFR